MRYSNLMSIKSQYVYGSTILFFLISDQMKNVFLEANYKIFGPEKTFDLWLLMYCIEEFGKLRYNKLYILFIIYSFIFTSQKLIYFSFAVCLQHNNPIKSLWKIAWVFWPQREKVSRNTKAKNCEGASKKTRLPERLFRWLEKNWFKEKKDVTVISCNWCELSVVPKPPMSNPKVDWDIWTRALPFFIQSLYVHRWRLFLTLTWWYML